ncbi:MAG: glycosyl hydrolase [Spirochaetae bacterium HGW-Spirochaetae-9]|nr:MAG: glycosyl hydrolase [Spirochaetae bacterium HGW-Spirochaetae-9]
MRWNYENGLILQAVKEASRLHLGGVHDAALRNVAEALVSPGGSIAGYRIDEFNIDQINAGKFVFSMWKDSGDERFKIAVEQLMGQLASHPRTASGSFWHKKIYPNQIWLDGLYMFGPFAARCAMEFSNSALFDDVCLQLLHARECMRDRATGLYFHAMDESRLMGWSDPNTGLSPHIWGRAVGWLSMALIDILDWLPENHQDRQAVIDMYRDLMKSVVAIQDGSGLWYQILDMAGEPGNYPEESASAMFAYSLFKGMRTGMLGPVAFALPAERALTGIKDRFISRDATGRVHVNGICKVAGLGGNPYRDGSYAYYMSEPVISDDYKGTGPLILALCEACR